MSKVKIQVSGYAALKGKKRLDEIILERDLGQRVLDHSRRAAEAGAVLGSFQKPPRNAGTYGSALALEQASLFRGGCHRRAAPGDD